MKQQEADFIEVLDTPNPEEMSFRVRVNNRLVFPTDIPALNTPFKGCKILANKPRVTNQNLGDYQYTNFKREGQDLWFYFAKPKTDAEKATPFRTKTVFKDFTWDMVLLGIAILPIPGFPQSTYAVVENKKTLVSATRYYGREIFIPQITTGTKHIIEEFTSPTKFDIPRHQTPITMPVNYEVLGIKREFPRCLHDDLNIDNTFLGISQVVAGSSGRAKSGAIEGYEFPATNFITWTAHYIDDDQDLVNGVWYRKRVRVIPPDLPKAVSQ